MGMSAAPRRATYDDLVAVPDNLVAEIVDGELFTSPQPATSHARAGSAIGSDLFGGFDGLPRGAGRPGGWWILAEPELHFGQDVLVPDMGGWRIERMSSNPNVVGITTVPDWVCEVISPCTARLDRTRKMPVYAREGVDHLWLVDPIARTLEVYRLEDGRWAVAGTYGGDESLRAEPVGAIALDMSRWWMPA
jgi:Uma2 family endonuclease